MAQNEPQWHHSNCINWHHQTEIAGTIRTVVSTSKADVIIPLEGCRYTENPDDYCIVGGLEEGYIIAIYCTNSVMAKSCGIEVEVPE